MSRAVEFLAAASAVALLGVLAALLAAAFYFVQLSVMLLVVVPLIMVSWIVPFMLLSMQIRPWSW